MLGSRFSGEISPRSAWGSSAPSGNERRMEMKRKDLLYLVSFVVLAALLLANLLRPGQPQAFTLPEGAGPGVAISAAGDSAWAIVGNKVYFLTLRPRGEVPNRIINLIDDEELN